MGDSLQTVNKFLKKRDGIDKARALRSNFTPPV